MRRCLSLLKFKVEFTAPVRTSPMSRPKLLLLGVSACLVGLVYAVVQHVGVEALLMGDRGFERNSEDPRILLEQDVESEHVSEVRGVLDECIGEVVVVHGRKFADSVEVYLCATQDSFNRRTAAADTSVARGAVFADRLFLSPRSFTTGTYRSILTHELSHLHFRQILGSKFTTGLPGWFQEGIAVYISGGGGAEPVPPSTAVEAIKRGQSLSPEDYGSRVPRMADSHGLSHYMFYRQSGLFVEFLASYEPERFSRLLEQIFNRMSFRTAFQTAYDLGVAEVWQDFVTQIRQPSAVATETVR